MNIKVRKYVVKNEINKVLKYFSIFAYHPTLDEIHIFLAVKINKTKLEIELKRLKYTPPQYSIGGKKLNIKYQTSKRKLKNWKFKIYIKLLSLAPQIKLIGLSGSISMMNAGENDDIDLFIITAKNRLFTGRLIALVLAQTLGLRRHRQTEKLDTVFFDRLTPKGPQAIVSKKVSSLSYNNITMKQFNNSIRNKICLNLFFDERELKIPKFKQTEFVGHEVLQMKPIVVKGDIYERFLEANRWVFSLFPNAKEVVSSKYKVLSIRKNRKKTPNTYYLILNTLTNKIEQVLKNFQLKIIRSHQTTELITNSQLWFHPDDFEKKVKY